jgi:phospholipid/cholesterol/gamma-HCH transport system substrate-binding protein
MTSSKQSAKMLRAGIFLAVCIGVLMFAVLMIGGERGMFRPRTRLYIKIADINGLVVGANARVAGLDVGTVTKITFPEDLSEREALIEIAVEDKYMPRLRSDSVAVMDSKGLLGDRIVNITIGSPEQPQLKEGDYLKTKESFSMDQLTKRFDEVVEHVNGATKQAEILLTNLITEDGKSNFARSLASLANVMEQVEKGDGVAHRLIYNAEDGRNMSAMLADLRSTASHANKAMTSVDRIMGEIEHGDGSAHAMIYGQDGKALVAELKSTAAELTAVMHDIRTGDGALHALVYGQQGGDMVTELSQFAQKLNHIATEIEHGRGTLGGLVMDPSVYEDMKSILGNVRRNVILKALFRFAIDEGGVPPATVTPAEPATTP